jgi:hypothetical protein
MSQNFPQTEGLWRAQKPRFASPSRGVLEAFQALGRPALPPTSNGQKTHRLLPGDFFVRESLSQAQDDAGSENIPLAKKTTSACADSGDQSALLCARPCQSSRTAILVIVSP